MDARKFLVEGKIDLHSETGAGLFFLADPEAGPMRFKKALVHDLSYVDVKIRGMNCLAYKWLPYSWKGKSIIDEIKPQEMRPEICYATACTSNGNCETMGMECFCYQGQCGG